MKFMKPRNFLTFALVALSGAVLLHTSQSVQHAENKLQNLQSSIERAKEQRSILRAEWESLNRPERLERLAREYLDMRAPEMQVLVDDAEAVPVLAPPSLPLPVLHPASASDEEMP